MTSLTIFFLAFITGLGSQPKSVDAFQVAPLTDTWKLKITYGKEKSVRVIAHIAGENGSFTTSSGHQGNLNCIHQNSADVAGRWSSGRYVGRFELKIHQGTNVIDGWLFHGGKKVAKISGRK